MSWVTDRDQWHVFDGWALAHGIDVAQLNPARFFDVVHHYILLVTDPKEHAKLNRQFVGASTAVPVIDKQAGFAPPSWWKGDDYASRSGIAARVTMKG